MISHEIGKGLRDITGKVGRDLEKKEVMAKEVASVLIAKSGVILLEIAPSQEGEIAEGTIIKARDTGTIEVKIGGHPSDMEGEITNRHVCCAGEHMGHHGVTGMKQANRRGKDL